MSDILIPKIIHVKFIRKIFFLKMNFVAYVALTCYLQYPTKRMIITLAKKDLEAYVL